MTTATPPRRPGCSPWAMFGCGCGMLGMIGIALVFLAIAFEISMSRQQPKWNREAFAGCELRLRKLSYSLSMYAKEHDGKLPARLEDLYPHYMTDPGQAHCPREGQPGTLEYRYLPSAAGNPEDPLVLCVNHGQGDIILQRNLQLRLPRWGERERKESE